MLVPHRTRRRTRDRPTPEQVAAQKADRDLVRIARGRGAVDVAIGETLLLLEETDGLIRLGFSRIVDYAREAAGLPARTAFFFASLARGLRERPFLRRAVLCGAVTPRKATAVMSLARGEAEEAWTLAAMRFTEAKLTGLVRSAGGEPGTEDFEVESIVLRMTPEQQDRLDLAIALAREILGHDAPRWKCEESIAQEALGVFGEWAPEEGAEEKRCGKSAEAWLRLCSSRSGEIRRQLEVVEEARAVAVSPGTSSELSPRALHKRMLRLMRARRRFDEPLGRMLAHFFEAGVWSALGYRSFAEYCRERLGVTERAVRQRIWLERKMCALPALRDALASGRLTYTKACAIAGEATPGDVEDRIEEAASTTWQQIDREATEREHRKNRAAGVRRLWGPKEAADTVLMAIAAVQSCFEEKGERISPGEALARMGDLFVEAWKETAKRMRMPRSRREVLMRHGGLCAWPACSRAAVHVHHIRYRSRGGTDDPENEAGLCFTHHQHGVHTGRLLIQGRAGELLRFRASDSDDVWVLVGDNDARRVG
jgi:hypothetical protein